MKIVMILLLLPMSLWAASYKVELEEGKTKAFSFSKNLQASKASYAAALGRAKVLKADYWPQFFLDGQYKRLEHLSMMSLPAPINRTLELGNHNNYSAGINLSYLLTDFGQTQKTLEGAEEEAKAEKENQRLTERQLELSVKNVFFKLFFQSSQLRALFDAWKLSLDQEKDMKKRFNSGTSSRLDYVNATKESLNFKLKFLQMQREYSATLQDWLTLTGEELEEGALLSPLPEDLALGFEEKASLAVKVALPEDRREERSFVLDTQHPGLEQLSHLNMAQELKKDSVTRSYFPRLSLGARSSLEYPDANKGESYNQNALFVSLTMPLWDGGKRSGQREAFLEGSRLFKFQRENLEDEMSDKLRKLNQSALQITKEIEVAKEGTKDAETLAQLTYQSYRNGQTNFLQVQSANLKVLEWKTQVDSLLYARSLVLAQLEFLGVRK